MLDPIREAIQSLNIQPEFFDWLIIAVVVVGSIWAAIRLYRDLTSPPLNTEAEARAMFETEE